MKKIACVHLLNDYSGSPLIFSTVVEGLAGQGYDCEMYTSADREGFLSNLPVTYRHFSYPWVGNRYWRLVLFLWSQWQLFWLLRSRRRELGMIYINTLLPFGAALAAWWMDKPVVYHLHEVSVRPRLLKRFLRWVARLTASKVIFVSHYLAEEEALVGVADAVVPNALSEKFKAAAQVVEVAPGETEALRVLMLCSLKAYKGVDVFVDLARQLPEHTFELVLNAEAPEIAEYFAEHTLPRNLHCHARQSNVHPFYRSAHLLLNLSHPEQWIETFGMTLLEGMHYGLPCIAPPVGGPAEIVSDGREGFLIDQRHLTALVTAINHLAQHPQEYRIMAQTAQRRAADFSNAELLKGVETVLLSVYPMTKKRQVSV